jgi:hypothetical protein
MHHQRSAPRCQPASTPGAPKNRAACHSGIGGGLNSPLLLLLAQVLVLVGLVRLAWLGVRWLWRRVLRREQAATATEAG